MPMTVLPRHAEIDRWLLSYLESNPTPSAVLKQSAIMRGFSVSSLIRSAHRLNVISSYIPGERGTSWALPTPID